jgi:hypothetical protein
LEVKQGTFEELAFTLDLIHIGDGAAQPARLQLSYDGSMSKGLFEIECPCCQTVLKIDPETRALISHQAPVKPPPIEDLAAAVAKLKGEAGRRDEVFRKQFEAEKSHGQVLNAKFDELLRQAKEHPDLTPPKRDIDLD